MKVQGWKEVKVGLRGWKQRESEGGRMVSK